MNSGSHEVHLDTTVEEAWNAIVAAGRHEWYFRLTPEGPFERGQTIRWVRGTIMEESEIVELDAPHRLVLRTRFVFAPAYAKEPSHTLTWEVSREGSGCRVRMSWEAGDLVGGFLASEGQYVLEGLRLEHDPAAQAEIARLATIGEVEVHDVTPDRVGDYQAFFDNEAFRDFPQWKACYCMEPQLADDDESPAVRTAAENRRDMTELITHRKVTALLAYVDGKPAGWCNYGDTTRFAGVMQRYELKGGDQEGVGSVACFVIAAPYRGHGIAKRLLESALDRMRARGVKVVEAYPLKDNNSAQSNFRGPLTMFLRAGFEPYRESGPVQIVRKQL